MADLMLTPFLQLFSITLTTLDSVGRSSGAASLAELNRAQEHGSGRARMCGTYRPPPISGRPVGYAAADDRRSILTDRQIGFVSSVMYFAGMPLAKISILLFYLTIIPDQTYRLTTYAMIAVNVAFGLAVVPANIFQCHPIGRVTFPGDADADGSCFDAQAFVLATGGINIGLELIVLILPIPALLRVRRPLRQRVAIIVLFSLGILYVVVVEGPRDSFHVSLTCRQHHLRQRHPIGRLRRHPLECGRPVGSHVYVPNPPPLPSRSGHGVSARLTVRARCRGDVFQLDQRRIPRRSHVCQSAPPAGADQAGAAHPARIAQYERAEHQAVRRPVPAAEEDVELHDERGLHGAGFARRRQRWTRDLGRVAGTHCVDGGNSPRRHAQIGDVQQPRGRSRGGAVRALSSAVVEHPACHRHGVGCGVDSDLVVGGPPVRPISLFFFVFFPHHNRW